MSRRKKSNVFKCPDCGLQVRLTRNTAVVKKKKSAAKQRQGARLASRLPRDEKGRFLPMGSENRFRRKPKRGSSAGRKTGTKRARLVTTEEFEQLFPDTSLEPI